MNKLREKIQQKIFNLPEKGKDYFLFTYSFLESFFFILPPPDPFLIYIIFTNTKKWIRYSSILIVASVVGGILSYIVGFFFFEFFDEWLLSFGYIANEFDRAKNLFNKNGFLAVFLAGLTPIPYTVFTVSAGVFKTNIVSFIIASVLGRGLRFYLVGAISYFLGKKFTKLFIKYFDLLTIILVLGVILYILF